MSTTLEVLLGDVLVGYLTNLDDDRTFFSWADEYREMQGRPVLTQGLINDAGALVDDERAVRRLAPPYFSNLLPEGGMRTLIARELGCSADRDFPLLVHLGADALIGAVRLIRRGNEANVQPARTEALALALPGVQLKLSAVLTEDDALTIPVRGDGGDWIVKVASRKTPGLVENEFSMLRLAERCGIAVPEIRLVEASAIQGIPNSFNAQGKLLAIRRFDRDGERRIHAEDFNQVYNQHPDAKYENHSYGNIARTLVERVGFDDARDFVRRVVFTALIGNGDMHLKNWSLVYRDGRTPKLAPGYDYVSTLPYQVDHNLGLSFGGSKSLAIFTEERLKRFAKDAALTFKVVKRDAFDMLERVRETWKQSGDLPLLEAHREIIGMHIAAIDTPGYELSSRTASAALVFRLSRSGAAARVCATPRTGAASPR